MAWVSLECIGAVARITLNRPAARNALSTELCRELLSVLSEVASLVRREHIRAAVLEGAPPAFCAGADLKERRSMDADAMSAHSRLISECADRVASLPCPIVAGIQGAALGGGLELALACDLRVASAHSELGFPEVRFGFFPGAGGPVRLSRLVGYAIATNLLLTGKQISGARAARLNVVHKSVAADRVQQQALADAKHLAALPPKGLNALRSVLRNIDQEQFSKGMELARQMRDALNTNPDVNVALQKFGR
jgi:methylglutaconyl-CoA hydratase